MKKTRNNKRTRPEDEYDPLFDDFQKSRRRQVFEAAAAFLVVVAASVTAAQLL